MDSSAPSTGSPLPAWAAFFTAFVLLALALSGVPRDAALPDGHDVEPHLINTVEFARCFGDGFQWPRWLPDVSGGFGGPNPLFYNPLPYHVSGRLAWLGVPSPWALKLTAILAMVLAFAGAYLWGLRLHDRPGALVVAAFYLLAPYTLLDLYVRFALPELCALALAPWLLLGVHEAVLGRRRVGLLITAVGLAALPLVHTLSTILSGGLVAGYGLALVLISRSRSTAAGLAGAGFAAILLAGFFWLPLVFDADQTHLERDWTVRAAWRDHLLEPGRLLENHWPGDRSHLPTYPGRLHLTLWAIAVILTARASLKRDPRAPLLWAFHTLAALCLFLTTTGSELLWARSPLSVVQFPWRFLGPAALAMASTLPLVPSLLADRARSVACVALVLYAGLYYRGLATGPNRDIQALTVQEIRKGGSSGDLDHHFIPAGSLSVLSDDRPVLAIAAGSGELSVDQALSERLCARIAARTPVTVDIRIFRFPGWVVRLDGQEVEPLTDPVSAGMRLTVPPGDHRLEVEFTPTPIRSASLALSVVTAVLLVVVLVPWSGRLRAVAVFLGVILVVTVCAHAGRLAKLFWDARSPWSQDRWVRSARTALSAGRPDDALEALARIDPHGPHGRWAATRIDRLSRHGFSLQVVSTDLDRPAARRQLRTTAFDTFTRPQGLPDSTPYTLILAGRLDVPAPGIDGLAMEVSGAARLLVDAAPALGDDLHFPLRRVEKAATLAPGLHEIAVLYATPPIGSGSLRLWWRPRNQAWELVPVERLTPTVPEWAATPRKVFALARIQAPAPAPSAPGGRPR